MKYLVAMADLAPKSDDDIVGQFKYGTKSDEELVLLLDKADMTPTNEWIFLAVETGRPKCLKFLLEKDLEVVVKGRGSVWYALANSFKYDVPLDKAEECLKHLLEKGLNLNEVVDKDRTTLGPDTPFTPLMISILMGLDRKVFSIPFLLLKNGAHMGPTERDMIRAMASMLYGYGAEEEVPEELQKLKYYGLTDEEIAVEKRREIFDALLEDDDMLDDSAESNDPYDESFSEEDESLDERETEEAYQEIMSHLKRRNQILGKPSQDALSSLAGSVEERGSTFFGQLAAIAGTVAFGGLLGALYYFRKR